jgi:hypothetical protein
MGKVQDPTDAVDQGKTYGKQSVDGALNCSVDQHFLNQFWLASHATS